MKNKKSSSGAGASSSRASSRGASQKFSDDEFEGSEDRSDESDVDEAEETNRQAAGSRQNAVSTQSSKSPSRSFSGSNNKQQKDFDPSQLLESARDFLDENPVRATVIGAIVGGAVAGLFATERGRSLCKAGYSYVRPMIADYARDFISKNSGNAIEAALPQ